MPQNDKSTPPTLDYASPGIDRQQTDSESPVEEPFNLRPFVVLLAVALLGVFLLPPWFGLGLIPTALVIWWNWSRLTVGLAEWFRRQ